MAKPEALEALVADLRSLDSKLGLIAQKIRTMEQNEEVIGRTLIALNQRLKKLEDQVASGGFSQSQSSSAKSANAAELERQFATKAELKELRYILDTINPLEYATIAQVRDLIKEKLGDVKSDSIREQRGPGAGAASLFKKL